MQRIDKKLGFEKSLHTAPWVRVARQIAKVHDTIGGIPTTISKAKARELAGHNGTAFTFSTSLGLDCPHDGPGECTFGGGLPGVDHGSRLLFDGNFKNGTDDRPVHNGEHEDVLTAGFVNPVFIHHHFAHLVRGSFDLNVMYTIDPHDLRFGEPTSITTAVRGTVVPEPGTPGPLGTGVIGLDGMMGRELKLGT